ncbi:peptidylprolyl isomerase [Mycolicibacterium hippocampi]|uniref:Peptidyl-prolyl cis-trans isomerase n=1 Tax=Mycolicibacterium hippocampi TaxID=659824 RepID=A0A850PI78_9MYCO|nr:Peptidyl-prolyl cis-trans isomerase [Mycolicibacterium hippocampi]
MTFPPPPYGGYPPPEGYPGGQYGYPGWYPPGYPPPRTTNSLAIASLVCAFLFAPLGVLFGHMSLSQIKRSGEDGRGLAIAGLVIGYLVIVFTVVVVVVSAVFLVVMAREFERYDERMRGDSGYPGSVVPAQGVPLPEFDPPETLGSNCQYPATTEPSSRPVQPPQPGRTPTTPESIPAGIVTDHGEIGLELDNAKAPCTVKNFVSLAEQRYFDDTRCHRLTVGADLRVLQCGDPTATGSGGPGYRFPNEYPSNQYRLTDPAMTTPVTYPEGTLAMANSGPGTNGSQFFLVYGDSVMPPTYTVFGTIDAKGLAALDDIATAGVVGGAQDGKPRTEVTVESVRVG